MILGSAAIKDKSFLKEVCEKFPNKIALGLDDKDGYLSVSGWKESSNQLTLDYLKEINDYGFSRLIYTDINRDGMKQSPNFEETSKVAEISNCPVIISGGVSSIDETPPDIIMGQFDILATFIVSSKFGLCFMPSLLISV